MKKLLAGLILLFPLSAMSASSYLDVIEFQFNGECSMSKYMDIVSDFNKWGDKNGYHAEIAVPLQSNNLKHTFWLGTAKNAAAYGKAWDTWRDAQSDPDSTPAKLWARLSACGENLSREGYDVY